MLVPALLTKLLVIIAFHWDVAKLTLLRVALFEVMHYRLHTSVDIVIVTDKPEQLSSVLLNFGYREIDIWPFNSSSSQFTNNKYDMLWEHRNIVSQAYNNPSKNYTTYLYMEDDTAFPWSQLVSWAIDSEMLEPLGFTRGIFRTEFNANGENSMNDMVVDLANYLWCHMNLTVDAANPHFVPSIQLESYSLRSKELLRATEIKYQRSKCPVASVALSVLPAQSSNHHHSHTEHSCPVHSHFVQLYNPLQGLWISSRAHLEKLMRHPLWDKSNSLKLDTRRKGQANWNWGYPERSNSILLFADPPPGFLTTNVVPYIHVNETILTPQNKTAIVLRPLLSPFARIEHVRNAYGVVCTMEKALTY